MTTTESKLVLRSGWDPRKESSAGIFISLICYTRFLGLQRELAWLRLKATMGNYARHKETYPSLQVNGGFERRARVILVAAHKCAR